MKVQKISRCLLAIVVAVCAISVGGCIGVEGSSEMTPPAKEESSSSDGKEATSEQPAAGEETVATEPPAGGTGESTPIAVSGGKAALTPANSKVMFVGIHTGDKPDPRTCGFAEFNGEATFSEDGKTLTGVSIEMQVDSLYSFNNNLTQHLKSGDFFDARQYPTAKFESTKVEIGGDGKGTMTGNLTLMKGTEEVVIPVTMTQSAAGFTLAGEVTIDRAKFGMDKMTEKVSKDVAVSFSLGQKTDPSSVLPK